jgi:hypothetical protein
MLHLEKLYSRETYLPTLVPQPTLVISPHRCDGQLGWSLGACRGVAVWQREWGPDVPEGVVWQREWGPDVPEGRGGDGGLQVLVHCGGHAHELGADEIGGAL